MVAKFTVMNDNGITIASCEVSKEDIINNIIPTSLIAKYPNSIIEYDACYLESITVYTDTL